MHKGAVHHRNSQKRIYLGSAVYFLTCATHHREHYFEEQIFCEVFVENLKICQRLKNLDLHAWFLGYDLPARSRSSARAKAGHFHMLVKPWARANYSKIMQSLKRNTSRDINKLINLFAGGIPQFRRYRKESHQCIGENVDPP